MRTIYREKRYYCGEYLDAFIYPVFETGRPHGGRRKRRKPSTEAQKKLNQRHREEKLARLLHANFTPRDIEVHLTYSIQPESDEEAKRHAANFIKKVKRYIKKHGLGELKYVAVTERGKRGGRYHHHVTISASGGSIDRDELEGLWTETAGHGYANSRRLQFKEEGLEGLARYIVKSTDREPGKKSWSASRNLVDPEPKTRDGRISGKKAKELAERPQDSTQFERLYPGYLLARVEAFHNDVNGGCYLVARLYREDGCFMSPQGGAEPERRQNRRKNGKRKDGRTGE